MVRVLWSVSCGQCPVVSVLWSVSCGLGPVVGDLWSGLVVGVLRESVHRDCGQDDALRESNRAAGSYTATLPETEKKTRVNKNYQR